MTTGQDSSVQQALHWHYAAELDDRNFQIGGKTVFFIIVLFSVTITVTLLLLYARWASRYNNSNLVPAHAPPQPDPAAASHLPITLHRTSSSGEELECCICLGVVGDGEKVKVLPECRHCYHSECVDRWLVARSSCPMCRTPIRAGSDAPLEIVVVTDQSE